VRTSNSPSYKRSPTPAENAEPVAALRLEDLSPYLSLRLLWTEDAKAEWSKDLVSLTQGVGSLLTSVFNAEEVKRIARIEGRFLECGSETSSLYFDETGPDLLARLNQGRSGWMAGCVLPVQKKPPWLKRSSSSTLRNTLHHLVCVALLPPFVAVSSTRPKLADDLVALLQDESALGIRLSVRLNPPPSDLLDKTFVRGEAFNVWLDGLHRPTVFKASSQTMQGPDLRRALDAISHRTFTYSSVREPLSNHRF